MNIDQLLIEISNNFLSKNLIAKKENLFISINSKTKNYKINITNPNKIIEKEINLDEDLCIEIDLNDALKMLEGKLNVHDSLFNGNIKLVGNIEVLNSIAIDIEKTT